MRVVRQEDIVEITRVELKEVEMRVVGRQNSAITTRVKFTKALMRVTK